MLCLASRGVKIRQARLEARSIPCGIVMAFSGPMPRLTDKDEIRTRLRRDPAWSVYALGDLAPTMFSKTLWFAPDLTLVVQDYGTAILFAMGPGSVREGLECVAGPVHLQVQRDALDEVARHATVSSPRLMWRMTWTGDRLDSPGEVTPRLAVTDVPALQALYADGESSGESPDFFFPSMVADGVFHGIYEGTALVAAAGTHLLAREEGAAAIGNVYTRRDRRGRGLGRLATSAVLYDLFGVETIGLNVRADNDAALHLYESLGFARHCQFYEALAMP
jgi:ribosomal protein S18 acetylase RimI-like enzyme